MQQLKIAGYSPQPEEHTQQFEEFFARIALRLRGGGSDFASRTGLSNSELSVLARLATCGPMSLKTLIADLGIPQSTMSAISERLEGRGLVTRSPSEDDRRSVRLVPTRKAEEMLDDSRSRFRAVVTSLLGTLTEDEQRDLRKLIRRMQTVL